jgi:predicted Zn-dependent protease
VHVRFHPQLKHAFRRPAHPGRVLSLRYVRESGQYLSVRKNVAEPPYFSQRPRRDAHRRLNGVEAYAATMTMISLAGLQAALERAEATGPPDRQPRPARPDAGAGVQRVRRLLLARPRSAFPSLSDCYALLGAESAAVPKDERLVSWDVSLGLTHVEQIYLNSAGAELRQAQRFVFPGMSCDRLRRPRQPDPHPGPRELWPAGRRRCDPAAAGW